MFNNFGELGNQALQAEDPRLPKQEREIMYDLPDEPSLEDVIALQTIGCGHHNLFGMNGAYHDLLRAKDALELAQETYFHLPVAVQTSHEGRYWGQEVQRALHEVHSALESSADWDDED